MTTWLSQKPRGLSAAGAIKVRGAAAPSRVKAPATDDVPERCIPSTTRAVFMVRATH